MPELPEVETVRRGLAPVLSGARIAAVEQRRADLRFPLPERFAQRLAGRRIETLERRAKYILARLEGAETLAVHLGMTGRFTIETPEGPRRPGAFAHAADTPPRHEHIVFHLDSGAAVRYADARRFGYMLLLPDGELAAHPMFARLGPEPLGPGMTPAYLAAACRNRRTDLKAALMDQRLVAGLGNIYVCEALHRARLSPLRAASALATRAGAPSAAAERLAEAIRAVLGEAIEAGGSSLRDYAGADGTLGLFQHSFAVYGRTGLRCPRAGCGGAIRRAPQGGRSTFHCPRCQR